MVRTARRERAGWRRSAWPNRSSDEAQDRGSLGTSAGLGAPRFDSSISGCAARRAFCFAAVARRLLPGPSLSTLAVARDLQRIVNYMFILWYRHTHTIQGVFFASEVRSEVSDVLVDVPRTQMHAMAA